MGYVWRKNGVALPETNASSRTDKLALTGVEVADAGAYSFLATNSYNTAGVESNKVTLTVVPDPVVKTQPAGLTVAVGPTAVARFSVATTVAPPAGVGIGYVWKKDGVTFQTTTSTATTASVTVPVPDMGAGGDYTVEVFHFRGTDTASRVGNSVTSTVAKLTTVDPPRNAVASTAQTIVAVGSAVEFNASVLGATPMGIAWRKNGVAVGGGAAPGMVFVKGGTLPDGSELAGQVVGDFQSG
jgi:hypothetical protein